MYIAIGENKVLRAKDILLVCDLDTTTVRRDTINYLSEKEKTGQAVTLSPMQLPKSFVVTGDGKVYISPLMASTIVRRAKEQ